MSAQPIAPGIGGAAPGARAPLRALTPAPRALWREVAAADGRALVSQTPEWIDALCASGDFADASRAYETARGAIVLPMVRRRGPWPRARAPQASMPNAWGMGGLLYAGELRPGDVAAVAADLARLPALRTSVRPNPLQGELWVRATGRGVVTLPRRAHVLDLRGGPDEIWQHRFHAKLRSGVRKAERSGLEVECGSSDRLVGAFHDLLAMSIDRWAGKQHEPLALARWRGRRRDPRSKFEQLAAALGPAMRIWVAFKDGAPVASLVVLVGGEAHYTRGAMDRRLAAPTRANDLLHWLAIRDACARGCTHYHLGESGRSASLAAYKERLGARPVDYAEYRFERLPLTRCDAMARSAVKRALRFRDA